MLKFILSSSVSRGAGAALGLFALGLLATPAAAVPVDVTYDITSLSITSPGLGGAQTLGLVPGSGTIKVRFASGTAGGHVSAGALHVVSGAFQLTNTFTSTILGNPISFSGFQDLTIPGSGGGNVTAAGAFTLGTVAHIASGFVHCGGAICPLAGFSSSVVQPATSGLRPLNITAGIIAGFPSLGPQIFNGAGNAGTGGGQPLILSITGQEISRTVVPEPGTGLLVGLGLVGLGITGSAFGARRRR